MSEPTSQTRRDGGASPLQIDTDEFCRTGSVRDGTLAVRSLPRLVTMLTDDSGNLRWRLAGRRVRRPDEGTDAMLDLEIDGVVGIACIRCLERVDATLALKRPFKLVSDEVLAEREDPDEDAYDVLVGARRFDVQALIEDEAIMGLPLAPRHDHCALPGGAQQPDGPSEEVAEPRPNPFAVLQKLRDAPDEGR